MNPHLSSAGIAGTRLVEFILFAAFMVWQVVRLSDALHIFQLEGYKRGRFLSWCRMNPRRAAFITAPPAKKPLVMTSRARRILVTAALMSIAIIVVAAAAISASSAVELTAELVLFVVLIVLTPLVVVAADALLTPVQRSINGMYLRRARAKLNDVDPVVIAVAGSFGKTSTKFAIAALIGESEEVLATPGSFNTPLGVCRTINEQLESKHRFFVVEMGAYKRGDIAELCRFVRPTVGVLTSIGPAHLERFGSMDVIRQAKYEVIDELAAGGTGVMNVDDPVVRALADDTKKVRVVRFGSEPEGRPDVSATDVSIDKTGTSMTIHADGATATLPTRLLGRYAISHVLAGVAVARALDQPLETVAQRAGSIAPVEHRLQLIEGAGGVTVIDDAFNSNPDGASAALEVLASMPANKRVVVTPGIIELGPMQEKANHAFGAHVARVADVALFVARTNRDALSAGARESGSDTKVITVDTLAEATEHLKTVLAPGDVVLFENDLPDQYEN
ncbi:MAG: UDP-N-acetylmuramoyl-tripeptide--D-alanyl-D-alanine ligase [Actinomycetota bacterium]